MSEPLREPRDGVRKVDQVNDGELHKWYLDKLGSALYYTICCDCGLVHLEKLTPRKRYIAVRVWRRDDLTKEYRRKKRENRRKRK